MSHCPRLQKNEIDLLMSWINAVSVNGSMFPPAEIVDCGNLHKL